MIRPVSQSISRKLVRVVMITTFMALLVSGVAMLLYDVHASRQSSIDDLTTQADLLGRSSAPALQFNDPATARGNLALLRVRPSVVAAALYTTDGRLFARYLSDPSGTVVLPKTPGPPGYRVSGNRITVTHPIFEAGEPVGTIYLQARYEWRDRLENYLIIMAVVMAASLAVAAIIAVRLQASVSRPILEVSGVAREVMRRRDYSLRAHKSTEDEVGVLVDAFNDMLGEVERRAAARESANRELQREMKERRDAEQALRLADRRKDEFLATLAHELRNPLAPLSNGLTLLRLAGDNPAMAQNARDIMERQLAQMVRLVDDLLDVSRISSGKLAVKKARVELQTVMRNALETAGPMIESRGHRRHVAMPELPIALDADATRLAQVFSNLLNNAAKYTEPGGRIGFTAESAGNEVVVTVTDNGIGIPAEMLERVFEMFAQVDQSLERSHAGLGVGLTLARRLVELHGGTLEVHSEGAGCGCRCVVRLPRARDLERREDGIAPLLAAQPGLPHRILLADDNVDFATTLAALLRRLGHEVMVTHDGEEALREAVRFRPDFAFLDIGLPGRNGYDLARALRLLPATSGSTLVAVTGWGQEKDRRLAAEAGFDLHLVKPVRLAQIVEVLEQADS